MTEDRLAALKRLSESRPGDPRLQFGLAVELLNRGEIAEGTAALRAYLDIADDEGNGWGRLGAALAELGDVEEAGRAYQMGIEIADRRGHTGLAEELREALEDLE